MEFRIADSFTKALTRLTRDEQKAVKTSAFDLQTNPDNPGLQLHRIDASKDPNFWSCRVNRDIRIIIHKTAQSFLLAYVDHHDDAYAWAERRRIEAHPKTGAIADRRSARACRGDRQATDQPIAARPRRRHRADAARAATAAARKPFEALGRDDLLSIGVPPDWLADVSAAHRGRLPRSCRASARRSRRSAARVRFDRHPHEARAGRRRRSRLRTRTRSAASASSRTSRNWNVRSTCPGSSGRSSSIPRNARWSRARFSGPARVAGSAGTGKTVVAIHRAARLASRGDRARVLLTTFSEPLGRRSGTQGQGAGRGHRRRRSAHHASRRSSASRANFTSSSTVAIRRSRART